MFVISDKIDKEMCPTYETLPEEKTDTMSKETNNNESIETDYKKNIEWECGCTNLIRSILVGVLCFLVVWAGTHYLFATRNAVNHDTFLSSPSERVHLLATTAINETQVSVESVRQEILLSANQNKIVATDYLNGIQEALKKRVGYSVKRISQLILDRVQDIENQLAVSERSISTLVDGIVDVTKHSIIEFKANVSKVSNPNDTSAFEDAVKRMNDEISELFRDIDQMFTYQATQINDMIYNKAQSITDRIRMILVADRKLFRNVAWQHAAICYNISKQNYIFSSDLETVLDAINKLRDTVDTVNVIAATFVESDSEGDQLMVRDKHALSAALNSTIETFFSMMNNDAHFLGATLKDLAYQKHVEMRDFVYKSYETVITSVLPAIEKVTRNYEVVRDSHWKRITDVVTPELTDLSKLIQTKVNSLVINDLPRKNKLLKDSAFEPIPMLMADRFKSIASTVNSFLQTKQANMIEGFSLTLVATMDEQLPLIATWSLQNYLPSDVCPLSVEFQTYMKGTMTQYLSQSSSLQVVPAMLEQALEMDAEFEYAANENENDADDESDELSTQLSTTDAENEAGANDLSGFIGSVMDMINTVLGSAGLTLDGPVDVYIDEDGKKKKK